MSFSNINHTGCWFTLKIDKKKIMLNFYWHYQTCWWPGDGQSQGISRHGFGLIFLWYTVVAPEVLKIVLSCDSCTALNFQYLATFGYVCWIYFTGTYCLFFHCLILFCLLIYFFCLLYAIWLCTRRWRVCVDAGLCVRLVLIPVE